MNFKSEDPIELINKEKRGKIKPVKGVKAYYIAKYDPRIPHPRQMITKNYHHIRGHPLLANLFPRENLVGRTRRQPNLSEMLSPTVQPVLGDVHRGGHGPGDDGGGGGVPGGTGGGGAVGGRWNGSYHCQSYRTKKKCDVCSHMLETSTVTSYYFNKRFAIHGHNVHLPAAQKKQTQMVCLSL